MILLTRQTLLLIALIITLTNQSMARPYDGLPFIRNFTADDYGAGIQNYAIAQDGRGVLYVGNNLGLLEYDGAQWTKYPVSNNTKVRALVVDAKGKIFVGAQNEFGYFFPSETGKLIYTSLSDSLTRDESNFGEVWKIFNTNSGIYFITFSAVFKYQNGQLAVIASNIPLGESFLNNQRIWVQKWEQGLMEISNDQFRLVSDNALFDQATVSEIIPFAENVSMICTVENGIFLYDNTDFTLWDSPYQEILKTAKISTAIRLRNGLFAIGTETDGVFILDNNGQFVDHITKGNGLNNRSVLSLYQDSADNLWAGLYNGITYIKYSNPFTTIDERVGLPGTGYASLLFNNQLLLGTNNGVFSFDGLQHPYSSETHYIKPIEGSSGKIYSLQTIDGKLFIGQHSGAYVLEPGSPVRRLSDEHILGWWKFQELSNHPDALIGGTYDGLFLLKKVNGEWTFISKIKGLNESSRVMEEDAEGNIWMSHGYKGVYKIKLNESLESIDELTFYDSSDGFPSNILINVFKVNNRLIFSSENGIYSFNEDTQRFVLDAEFSELLGDKIQIREMTEDSNGNIYFIGDLFSGRLTRTNTGAYELNNSLFNNVDRNFNDDLENISIIDAENVLIGGKEGFVHYNPTAVIRLPEELNLLIRSVQATSTDSTLFSGSYVQDGEVTIDQPASLTPTLDYDDNSLLFSFTTTDFDTEKPAEYRYLMEGMDKEWSEWTVLDERGYTNLDEGKYTLKIEARNQHGLVSNELHYSFRVRPPYYRSPIAYGIYGLLFVLSLTLLILSMRKKYHNDKRQAVLEEQKKLEQKENEFSVKAKESEEEIVALRNEKLKSEISYKNKELANSTMHLISKNEFISKVKDQLSTIANTSSMATSKELRKIAKDIDRNLASDDDWKQFEIHFDEVHGDFSRRLKAAYPQLTNQDMKLCAFLKLNMSTKEIANVLNITIRGVELSRYRLRKKLELDRAQNLTDFILGF